MKRFFPLMSLALALQCALTAVQALACPFCSTVSQTFTEEIQSMDIVVIADLVALPPIKKSDESQQEVPKAKFKVRQIVKGKALAEVGQIVETVFFGEAKKGAAFLVMGVDPPKIAWSTPLPLSERARKYVPSLLDLPTEGPARLVFFQQYLEDADEMLARDAYDEFAKAPYEEIKLLKPNMDHDKLIVWIQDADIPASRRRLYLTLLGVCGNSSDVAMLEDLLKSDDRKKKAGLDAMIGCYLTLKGPAGMPLIEELFLKNAKAEYADTYAAIMALRFHGSETDVIPRERILQGLRHMLSRPQLADLVIPDLARWEDWSVMDRLVQLFKDADDKTSWVRVPVINYLRACPNPMAKKQIALLEKIDPTAVKRANTFFPFGASGASKATTAKTKPAETKPAETEPAKTKPAKATPAAGGAGT
ncbi:MAG: hypothetical protein QF918_15035 [Pirellulaceae bacterium]|jgi:hypothetical protein|nr:hypothetical protein [Pirellulaceae bacterium]MDP6554280.1 hypothetical protein [Pirellulaceae bacterium]